jgi:hypothetical protein
LKQSNVSQQRQQSEEAELEDEHQQSASNTSSSGGRNWIVEYCNTDKISVHSMSFSIKTRTDPPATTLPEKLYSSLKYKFKQTLECTIHGGNNDTMLISKMQVFNVQTGLEVVKNKKPILVGNHNDNAGTLQTINDSRNSNVKEMSCETAFRFNDVSYHHSKADFRLKLSFFLPSDMTNPVFIVSSPPFQVYARRSAIQKKQGIKGEEEEEEITPKRRRRSQAAASADEEEGETETGEAAVSGENSPAKKVKPDLEPTLQNYLQLFDELLLCKDRITNQVERKLAANQIMSRLASFGPTPSNAPSLMPPHQTFNTLSGANVNLATLSHGPNVQLPYFLPMMPGIPMPTGITIPQQSKAPLRK